jgi:DNA modification methylase
MSTYEEFLTTKMVNAPKTGFDCGPINAAAKPFQADIIRWALKRGRAGIFADTGLGKTFMQLEWARHVAENFGPVLILAPLAVGAQTVREAAKFGIDGVEHVSERSGSPIQVSNYEKLHRFDPSAYAGIVLDESSILKGFDGKFRKAVTEFSNEIAFRLPCTATPAPNDYMELGNHAEYLGIMTCAEMLAMFFTHDGGDTSKWRLKGHAQSEFWKWVCSWAVAIRKPSDLGYSNDGYILPNLHMIQHTISSGIVTEGSLFQREAETLSERQRARSQTVQLRADEAAAMVNASNEHWIVWCDLNAESDALTRAIPGAVEVRGSDSAESKERALDAFSRGEIRVLVSKPSICGFGMNWQHCRNIAFVGLSDSFEQLYQAIRRCWRFGQQREVYAHIITADIEGAVVRNIQRKEQQAMDMMDGMVEHMRDEMRLNISSASAEKTEYSEDKYEGKNFTALLGDCVQHIKRMPDESVDYSVFSPPFASLYTYSNSDRDMGNCRTYEDFEAHFKFLIPELYRVMAPGRNLSFHCMNLPLTKERDGVIGIRDFRGELIRWFTDCGFVFHSEVCIWKDPVTAMQRTKAIGLLYKQLRKDSTISRQGIPDYVVTMRKPGVNPRPVTKTYESFPVDLWQKYASPVWMDIDQSDTLSRDGSKDEEDERHICALQLGVIERCLLLWSNPGDLVLSPFMGIGSEGYMSIKNGRRFIGTELKRSYWQVACKNLKQAELSAGQQYDLFAESSQ